MTYLSDADMALLPDLLLSALSAEKERRKWEAYIAFTPFAALIGKSVEPYTPDLLKRPAATAKKGTDEDVQKILEHFGLTER